MALTAGTYPQPIKPYGGFGGTLAAPEFVIPIDPSETILAGDILTINQTTFDVTNTQAAGVSNPTGATGVERIYGVVSHAATSAATVDRTNEFTGTSRNWVHLWPALCNMMFTGNIVGGATTDYTGVYATCMRQDFGTISCTDPTPDVAALNQADTTNPVALVHFFATQRAGGPTPNGTSVGPGFESGVGVINPRVAFTFLTTATVWGAGQ